jgi:hypothetical protein
VHFLRAMLTCAVGRSLPDQLGGKKVSGFGFDHGAEIVLAQGALVLKKASDSRPVFPFRLSVFQFSETRRYVYSTVLSANSRSKSPLASMTQPLRAWAYRRGTMA